MPAAGPDSGDLSDLLLEATVEDLRKAMQSGILTSRQLVTWYLERIARFDKGDAPLNTVLEINPDALWIAESLDAERAASGPRGPLHGIPVLVKDNIDTCDKMHTSAGSIALTDSYPAEDSAVAARLRAAGAVIIGKANMTEWANFMTRNMPGGYSSRGGQVLNPYGPGKFGPGGSSSGSGAAVAANLTALAIGTETSGSILSPASMNSVVGVKPTVGLVSRTGIIPIMFTQDTAGPLTRTVADAAALLEAIAGPDDRDPATLRGPADGPPAYTGLLDPRGLEGARLGVPREYYERLDTDQAGLMNLALEQMKAAGATVVDPVTIPSAKDPWDGTAMLYEFKTALNAYLGRLSPHVPVHTLKELIEFNSRHAERALRYGQLLLVEAEAKSGRLTEPEYVESLSRNFRRSRDEGIDAALKEHSLDALVFPGNFGAGIAARACYPSISVPGGYAPGGRPLGVTFTAGEWEEPLLFRLAYAYERLSANRKPPLLA